MKSKRTKPNTPSVCPVCGEDVPHGALACPECGADDRSGWRDDAGSYDGVDLPDESFSYDEFVKQEFGSSPKPAGMKILWWITAIVVSAAFIAIYLYAAR